MFEPHEFLDISQIHDTLVGDSDRPDLRGVFQSELERIALLKLSLGERVVINVPDFRKEHRIRFAKTAINKGFQVFYMVKDLMKRKDLIHGDSVADVVDCKMAGNQIIKNLPDDNFFTELRNRGYQGVTVIADIHGNLNACLNSVSWAKSRNHFILFLGDILDYGINTLEVVDEVYKLVTRGEAEILMGNHERKIYRYLLTSDKQAFKAKLSEGNKVTVRRIENLSKFDYDRWVSRFKALVGMMRNHRNAENFSFAHCAVVDEMRSTNSKRLTGKYEDISMFGEMRFTEQNKDSHRSYAWVDNIPADHYCIVGHDVRSNFEPLTQVGKLGGTAIFLDTGCGKGGHLSTVDIRFYKEITKVENFNIH